MGQGPVDVFSTRFNQFFTPEAHGTICGHLVDREGLKSALLALQRRWSKEAKVVAVDGAEKVCICVFIYI